MPEDLDYSRFTVKDMLTLVVLPRLDSIDRKLDTKSDVTDVIKLESRVSSVEAWRNRLAGAVAVIGVIATSAIGLVVAFAH